MSKLIIRDKGIKKRKEYYREYCKKYYKEHREKLLAQMKKYHESKEGKTALLKAKNKQTKRLTDYYIKNNIYVCLHKIGHKVDRKSITKEQIKKYRQTLIAKREYKKQKYENKQTT
jgi:hypothetical protein